MSNPRTAFLVGLLLAIAAAMAGCTDKDDGATDGTDDTGGTGGTGGNRTTPATPEPFVLEDSGAIAGPFSKAWGIEVENVAFTSAMIHFALSGAQAGAPPTARVNLELQDPEGAIIKSAVLGLGGEGDMVEWTLTPVDLPAAGTYSLVATSGGDAPLPSVGIANYELAASVTY